MSLAVGATLLACKGGGGDLGGSSASWEAPPRSEESTSFSGERAPSTSEGDKAPPSTSFDCAGTYACVNDDDDDQLITLVLNQDGTCSVRGSSIVIAGNGTVLLGERVIGSWQPTANGFRAQTGDANLNCMRTNIRPETNPPSDVPSEDIPEGAPSVPPPPPED